MRKKVIILVAVSIIFSMLPVFGQEVSYSNPNELKNFLPTLKGFRLGMKDLVTWSQIGNRKFPMVLRTYFKNSQKVIIKITDAHYEPVAYRDYYFYVDIHGKNVAKTEKFFIIRINGENVYVHQKMKMGIISGTALIGNRYLVEVVVNRTQNTDLMAKVMEQIDFQRLAAFNNPARFRNIDFREKHEGSNAKDVE